MRVVLLTSVAVATLSLMPVLANAQGAGGGERGGAAEKAPGRGGEGGGAQHMEPGGMGAGGERQGGPAAETKGAPGEKPAGRAAAEPPAGGRPGAAPNGAAKTEGKAGEGKAGTAPNERAGEAGQRAPGQNAAGKEGARESGGKSVKVSSEQRTKIQSTIRSEHVESLHNVTFAVSVGTLVPERYHYYPLPPAIIEYVPEFRGYDYILVGDEIIIIEPGTRRIVEIIE